MGLLTNLEDSISRAASTLSPKRSEAYRIYGRERRQDDVGEPHCTMTGPATPSARRVTFPTRLVVRAERRTLKSSATGRK